MINIILIEADTFWIFAKISTGNGTYNVEHNFVVGWEHFLRN